MRKRTVRILTGVAVIVVVLGLSYAIAVAISAGKLRRAYAALEKDGRPMQPSAIIPSEVNDIENAALLYQSAISMLKAEPSGRSRQSPSGESVADAIERERDRDLIGHIGSLSSELARGTLSPEKHRELKELMGRRAVDYALFAVEEAVHRSVCRFHRNYDAGMNVTLPELSDMKGLASVVGAKARLEAEAGAMDRAWQLAAMEAKLGDAYTNDPIMICQLVRMAIINQSCKTIQRLCETSLPGKEQQERLETLLRAFDDVTPMVRAVDGDRVLMGEWLFTRPRKELYKVLCDTGGHDDRAEALVFWLIAKGARFRPLFLADHANYIRVMQANAQAMASPYSTPMPEERHRYSALTSMLVPAMGRVRMLHGEMATETRITRAGLALLQYRAAHGAFPATLDALNLEGLGDPFIEGPLHYRAEGEGFILYSVGGDMKDNGGTPKPERRDADPRKVRHTEYDILWHFPGQTRPAAQ